MAQIRQNAEYTEVERDTVTYLRDRSEWSDAAAEGFGTELGKWSATKIRG